MLAIQPASAVDEFLFHHGDMGGGATEGGEAKQEEINARFHPMSRLRCRVARDRGCGIRHGYSKPPPGRIVPAGLARRCGGMRGILAFACINVLFA